MSLSSQEAQASLAEAEQARRRSAEVYFYRRSSPHLIMWGVIWILGYGGCQYYPQYSNWIWWPFIALGVTGGIVIGRATAATSERACNGRSAWRMVGLLLVILGFISGTYAILSPTQGAQFAAYPALITGTAYSAIGLWVGMRYLVTGILVMALTLVGYFYLQPYIFLWLALVGGGSMVLAGLWFRTV